MPSVLKSSGKATILGEQSGGGSCVVIICDVLQE